MTDERKLNPDAGGDAGAPSGGEAGATGGAPSDGDTGPAGRGRRGMTVAQSRAVTLVLLGLMTVLSIHLANEWFEGLRVDLTGDDLYSLTDGSHAILDRMQEEGVKPLDIRLYFSETTGKTLPKFVKDFIGYERYLRSLLGEYERAAAGKIQVAWIDPIPDSDAADRAAEDGLDGKLINQNGDLFYFGVAFETQTGSRETIEFLWPQEQENIEYEISKKIHGLLWPTRQRVGVLSSLEVFGGAQDPMMAQMLAAQGRTPSQKWILIQVLEDLYDVSQVPADVDEIAAADYDLLVVIHPKALPDKTVFAIDQWVAAGGNTLVFLDPYALGDTPPQNPQQPWAALQYQPASNLAPLLDAWGLELLDNEFAADFELAARRPMSQFGASESVIIDLVVDSTQHDDVLDAESPMLRGLSELRFFLAGVLRESDAEATADVADAEDAEDASVVAEQSDGIERRPLISTTAAGATLGGPARLWRRRGPRLHGPERRRRAARRLHARGGAPGPRVRRARQAADGLPRRRGLSRQGGGATAEPAARDRGSAARRCGDHPTAIRCPRKSGKRRPWSCSRTSTSSTTRSPSCRTRSGSSRPRTTTTRSFSTASTTCSAPRI